MPDPSLVAWADGTLHAPAGGQHKESDPVVAELSGDARLPSDLTSAQKRLDLAANTAAKMMRAAHQAQTALNKVHLFDCRDADGTTVRADPLSARDGVALQVLKRLARAVERLELCPLEEGETELDRAAKVTAALSQMTKHQAVMEQSIAKAVGMSTRASQEAAKLQFAMRAHEDKMALAKDGAMTAIDIEKIANS